MLLNLKIQIEITNDGQQNFVFLTTEHNNKVIDIYKCLDVAQETIENLVDRYFEQNPHKDVDKMIETIKIRDVQNQASDFSLN
jgi:hypothetical protein